MLPVSIWRRIEDGRNGLQQNIVPCNPLSNISSTFLFLFFRVQLSSERTNRLFLIAQKCVKMLIPFLFSPISLLHIAENN